MHLADGIVTRHAVLVGVDLVGAGALVLAARRADLEDTKAVAWTGMLGAFLLAAQALNVPLLPGTSAHVIGATLVTLAVGPARAIVAMTAVLLVQALLLGDGGITALGVNVLNLAVLPSLAVEGCARVFGRTGRGLAITSVAGTILGSTLGAVSLSATLVYGAGAAPSVTVPWLVGVQALAGVVEGVLTAVAVERLERRAPGLLSRREDDGARARGFRSVMAWTAIALGVVAALLPLASSAPDALERLVTGLHQGP